MFVVLFGGAGDPVYRSALSLDGSRPLWEDSDDSASPLLLTVGEDGKVLSRRKLKDMSSLASVLATQTVEKPHYSVRVDRRRHEGLVFDDEEGGRVHTGTPFDILSRLLEQKGDSDPSDSPLLIKGGEAAAAPLALPPDPPPYATVPLEDADAVLRHIRSTKSPSEVRELLHLARLAEDGCSVSRSHFEAWAAANPSLSCVAESSSGSGNSHRGVRIERRAIRSERGLCVDVIRTYCDDASDVEACRVASLAEECVRQLCDSVVVGEDVRAPQEAFVHRLVGEGLDVLAPPLCHVGYETIEMTEDMPSVAGQRHVLCATADVCDRDAEGRRRCRCVVRSVFVPRPYSANRDAAASRLARLLAPAWRARRRGARDDEPLFGGASSPTSPSAEAAKEGALRILGHLPSVFASDPVAMTDMICLHTDTEPPRPPSKGRGDDAWSSLAEVVGAVRGELVKPSLSDEGGRSRMWLFVPHERTNEGIHLSDTYWQGVLAASPSDLAAARVVGAALSRPNLLLHPETGDPKSKQGHQVGGGGAGGSVGRLDDDTVRRLVPSCCAHLLRDEADGTSSFVVRQLREVLRRRGATEKEVRRWTSASSPLVQKEIDVSSLTDVASPLDGILSNLLRPLGESAEGEEEGEASESFFSLLLAGEDVESRWRTD